jgi:ethanolaminephosphotransferase
MKGPSPKALFHLVSPLILALTTLLFPTAVIATEQRLISLACGLAFSFVTNKMIVFSMAKMTFATFQPDVLPFLFTALACRYGHYSGSLDGDQIHNLILGVSIWQGLRLVYWSRNAINQLCKRLKVECFSIPYKGKAE